MRLFSLARTLSRNFRLKIVDCRLLNLSDLGFRCQGKETENSVVSRKEVFAF